ncbi:MAG: uroporphyrinogen decarboxylase family protein [bacterium]
MKNPISTKERMEAVFNGRKPDRAPVFLLLGGHCAEKAGYTLHQFLTDPAAAIDILKVTCSEISSDNLFVPFNPYMPDAQEAIRKLMGKLPSVKKPDIKEKLPKWKVRDPREDKLFSQHLDLCKQVAELFPNDHLESLVGGPWSMAMELRGIEEALEDAYEDKPFLQNLMKYTTEAVIARCAEVVKCGIVPFIGDPSSGMSLISPTIYREFVYPYHKQLADAVMGMGSRIVFHICGYVDPILEDLFSLGIDGLSIDAPTSLEKAFSLRKGKTVIIGNVDPLLFVHGTPEQLEEKVKECFAISKGDARYVVGPGCQVPVAAPISNIRHFIECCHRYGAYA